MYQDIREQLVNTIIQMKKSNNLLPLELTMSIGEFMVLRNISNNCDRNGQTTVGAVSGTLPVSRPAISQILGNLEKKGFIKRIHSKTDHRKITVKITPSGETFLSHEIRRVDDMLDKLILKMGTEQMHQLIVLLDRLSDAAGEIRAEYEDTEATGHRKEENENEMV